MKKASAEDSQNFLIGPNGRTKGGGHKGKIQKIPLKNGSTVCKQRSRWGREVGEPPSFELF